MAFKVLITGGAGYIASHTIIDLIEAGYEIISVDNLCNSNVKQLERVASITQKSIKNYQVDLCNKAATIKVFEENPDIIGVIHFAALKSVPESVSAPGLYYSNNLNSLTNILFCIDKFNIKNLVFSSSCSVYGNATEMPVTENTELKKAESPYAHTKQLCEQIIDTFIKTQNTHKCISLRYFNPAGAHLSAQLGELPTQAITALVPNITAAAIHGKTLQVYGNDYPTPDGTCVRDYIHVMDIAHAHTLAITKMIENNIAEPHTILNLGTGNGYTVLESIQAFEKANNVKLNYNIVARREGDVVIIYANNDKAFQILNWKPKYNISEIMSSAWQWQLNLQKEL